MPFGVTTNNNLMANGETSRPESNLDNENENPNGLKEKPEEHHNATVEKDIDNRVTFDAKAVASSSGPRVPSGLRLGGRNNSFFETKLDIEKEMEERNKREFDVWGRETYLNATRQSNLIPMTIAVRQLPTKELNLSHRVIDAHDLRPLCLALHVRGPFF